VSTKVNWQRVRCESCNNTGVAIWDISNELNGGAILEVPKGFTFHDDGRTASYFTCDACNLRVAGPVFGEHDGGANSSRAGEFTRRSE
jgi:hypothetical protein